MDDCIRIAKKSNKNEDVMKLIIVVCDSLELDEDNLTFRFIESKIRDEDLDVYLFNGKKVVIKTSNELFDYLLEL